MLIDLTGACICQLLETCQQLWQRKVVNRPARQEGLCCQLQAVNREKNQFGQQIREGNLAITKAGHHRLDRMGNCRAEFKLAQRGIALDVVDGPEKLGGKLTVGRRFLEPGNVALDLGRTVDQRIGELLQRHTILNHWAGNCVQIHFPSRLLNSI